MYVCFPAYLCSLFMHVCAYSLCSRPSPVLPSFLAPPEGCEESFFRLEPTAYSNGCFLAVLTREVRSF